VQPPKKRPLQRHENAHESAAAYQEAEFKGFRRSIPTSLDRKDVGTLDHNAEAYGSIKGHWLCGVIKTFMSKSTDGVMSRMVVEYKRSIKNQVRQERIFEKNHHRKERCSIDKFLISMAMISIQVSTNASYSEPFVTS